LPSFAALAAADTIAPFDETVLSQLPPPRAFSLMAQPPRPAPTTTAATVPTVASSPLLSRRGFAP
jgi:hypothetical protein